ncbi:MAG TPA: UDP-glucose 4-epimerase GalE [Streptosporangiaceae bacterium]|nr:UDP-glucose 4-epimerase GalE [Streptosporangiaceae bacterium]
MSILITGGAGFIGSHACVELLEHDYDVVVVDNFSNSSPAALDAVRELTGRELAVHEVDVRDASALDKVFRAGAIEAVIHFAGKKAVGESTRIPLDYFDVNVTGTITLLRVMRAHGVHRLVFSSSCSIYGDQYSRPITEADRAEPVNPYARSKLICEQVIESCCGVYPDLRAISLRYFNPAGAHRSGLIGESPLGVPSNVVPHMAKVAAGKLPRLHVFGDDYDTPDGSAIRDYIHVLDLVQAHRLALEHLADEPGMRVLNLGTGTGLSVLELVRAFEQACGVTVPFDITARRPGDVASLIADPGLVTKEWGWRTSHDTQSMLRDAWHFERRNPDGYADPRREAGAGQ